MTKVTEVTDGIFQIDVDEFRIAGSSESLKCSKVFFIVDNGQDALIETGPAIVAPVVRDAIHQLGYDLSRLSYILLTHIHIDHAGGAGTLANQFPQLQVLVHQRGVRHLMNPSRLIEGTRQAYGEGFENTYGPISPVPERQVRIVEDKEIILLGKREFKVIYAPGHAPHQMCIYDINSKSLFSGEALGIAQIENSIVEPAAGFDFDAAVETIDRLGELDINVVLSSHGGACWEPARLIDSVRVNTKTCGDIILKAMRSGEGREQISHRLKLYQMEQNTDKSQPPKHSFDQVIPWYEAYFRSNGIS